MLPIITCLTLLSVIYIVHVQADEQDDPIDSNIFSSSEKQELKIFQGHQRWLHKKALRQLKEKEATSRCDGTESQIYRIISEFIPHTCNPSRLTRRFSAFK
ncbi:uncharacterized protein LOC135849016 isoform X3 [Planococcus citri]|uniref:uncharacterized protein LOC135849016 isoform X3 n=1 Tax=Planococcus citri TaxID=170843 RepID=UPI0031F92D63